MTLDQKVAVFSALVSLAGLAFVALQIRQSTRQRAAEALVEIYDINRQLLTLGFSHPAIFEILEGKDDVNPVWERYYLQLWLNHRYAGSEGLGISINECPLITCQNCSTPNDELTSTIKTAMMAFVNLCGFIVCH